MGNQITFYDRMQAFTRLADKGMIKSMTFEGGYLNFHSLPEFYGIKQLSKSTDGHTFISTGVSNDNKLFCEKVSSPVHPIPPWKSTEAIAVSEEEKTEPATLIRDGKYLAVCVDLTRKKSKILADFESLLDTIVPYIGNETQYFDDGRGKDHSFIFSIWKVYDLCVKTQKPNFTEVARALTQKKGQARDDVILAAGLKVVRRAYKRALEIIKIVDDEIKKKVDA